MSFFKKLGQAFKGGKDAAELTEDFVELEADVKTRATKVIIRPFTLDSFEDIKPIVDAIRDGATIALVNLGPLKEKDKIGMKRAVEKLKKTVEANEGDIAGFGENWLIATPSFASVYREGEGKAAPTEEVKKVEPF